MIATVTLYGANINVASSPLVTSVASVIALSGYKKAEFNVDWVDPQPTNEGALVRYLNSYQFALNAYRMSYKLVTEANPFPDTDTDILVYEPFLEVINKKFHWIDLNDYKLKLYASQDGTNCMRINIADYSLTTESGNKYWNIELSELKQNMKRI